MFVRIFDNRHKIGEGARVTWEAFKIRARKAIHIHRARLTPSCNDASIHRARMTSSAVVITHLARIALSAFRHSGERPVKADTTNAHRLGVRSLERDRSLFEMPPKSMSPNRDIMTKYSVPESEMVFINDNLIVDIEDKSRVVPHDFVFELHGRSLAGFEIAHHLNVRYARARDEVTRCCCPRGA